MDVMVLADSALHVSHTKGDGMVACHCLLNRFFTSGGFRNRRNRLKVLVGGVHRPTFRNGVTAMAGLK